MPDARLTQDLAYFCPTCGSAALERSALAGGSASCKTCPWTGKTDELQAVPFSHDFASGDEALARFVGESANVLMQHMGVPVGRLLLKWGFTTPEVIAAELPIFGKAIATAMVRAILETREGLATGKIARYPKKPEAERRGIH